VEGEEYISILFCLSPKKR